MHLQIYTLQVYLIIQKINWERSSPEPMEKGDPPTVLTAARPDPRLGTASVAGTAWIVPMETCRTEVIAFSRF